MEWNLFSRMTLVFYWHPAIAQSPRIYNLEVVSSNPRGRACLTLLWSCRYFNSREMSEFKLKWMFTSGRVAPSRSEWYGKRPLKGLIFCEWLRWASFWPFLIEKLPRQDWATNTIEKRWEEFSFLRWQILWWHHLSSSIQETPKRDAFWHLGFNLAWGCH